MNETELHTIRQLSEYKKKFAQARRYNDQINTLRSRLYGLHITDYEREYVSGGKPSEQREALIDKMEEVECLLAGLILDAQRDMMEIDIRIDRLDYPYNEVLKKRYCDGLKFEKIAIAMSYSYPQIMRIHKKAISLVNMIANDR